MMPTLPLLPGWAFSHSSAASQSATTLSSGTPPCARTLAVTSSGVPWPKRQYRSGQITGSRGARGGRRTPVELVPARQVVHGTIPGSGPSEVGPGDVGVDLVAAATGIGDHFRRETVERVGAE